MKPIFKLLIISTLLNSCQKKNELQQNADSLKTTIELPKKTPQEVIQQIDNQLVLGDSLHNELNNEESLEGGTETAYFDENFRLTKIVRDNFGETYTNKDQFYFDSTLHLIAVKTEKSTYNRSTYEESNQPLIITSQGVFTIIFEGNKILSYQKINNKRKFEDKTESQEVEYWVKRAENSSKYFETNKESDFYSKFTQLQYDETKNSPIHVLKIQNKMYCLNNFDDEVFKNSRFDKIKTPSLGIIELTYKPDSGGWYQTKTSTFFQSKGEVKIDKSYKIVEIDHQKYMLFSFQLFESNGISKYFTAIILDTLSSTSLIISNGKSNETTISNKTIRDILVANSK